MLGMHPRGMYVALLHPFCPGTPSQVLARSLPRGCDGILFFFARNRRSGEKCVAPVTVRGGHHLAERTLRQR